MTAAARYQGWEEKKPIILMHTLNLHQQSAELERPVKILSE